jgi:hypothetical protein
MKPIINLFLHRVYLKKTYTIGNLSITDRFFCNTLEDTVRDYNHDGDLTDYGEVKIPGETAIPYGRYPVIVTISPKLKRELPLIVDVKHFTGIRIHKVATAKGTEGCVGIGINSSPGRLTEGEKYEKKLVSILKTYISTGFEIFINIV